MSLQLSSNYSNITDQNFDFNAGHAVFEILLLVFILVPVIAANILILVTLVYESQVNTVIRLMLGNIPLACIIESLGHVLLRFLTLIVGINQMHDPSTVPCSLSIFLVCLGGIGRITFMAAFSITVYLIVKNGKDRVYPKYFLPAMLILWTAIVLLAAIVFIPDLMPVEFSLGYLCRPYSHKRPSVYVLLVLLFIFAYVAPLAITITFIWKTYIFIKHRVVNNDMIAIKSMTKFSLFLIMGNTINIISNAIPTATLVFSPHHSYSHIGFALPILYLNAIFSHLALIPSCVLIINYFQPLRERMKKYFKSCFQYTCTSKKGCVLMKP